MLHIFLFGLSSQFVFSKELWNPPSQGVVIVWGLCCVSGMIPAVSSLTFFQNLPLRDVGGPFLVQIMTEFHISRKLDENDSPSHPQLSDHTIEMQRDLKSWEHTKGTNISLEKHFHGSCCSPFSTNARALHEIFQLKCIVLRYLSLCLPPSFSY